MIFVIKKAGYNGPPTMLETQFLLVVVKATSEEEAINFATENGKFYTGKPEILKEFMEAEFDECVKFAASKCGVYHHQGDASQKRCMLGLRLIPLEIRPLWI